MIGRQAADTWEYVEDRLVANLAPWRASLFTVGNGFLGTRGTFEEGFDGQEPATFIHGLFVTPPGDLPVLGAVPDWTGVAITVDGEALRLDRRPAAGFERRLNMRTGVLTRTVVWKGADTGVVKAVFRRTASMAEPGLVALDITFTALTETLTIKVETGLDATVAGPYGALWQATGSERTGSDTISMSAVSVDDAHQLDLKCRVTGLSTLRHVGDQTHPRLQGTFTLESGQSATLTKFVLYTIPGQPEADLPLAGTEFGDVVDASAVHWTRRWKTSRIDVGGDREAERVLRFAAFQIIASAPPRDTPGSIGARMLTGYGYRHHVFWDTDIYVLPYLSIAQPDLAATHLRYRHRGLAGARNKAARYGRDGAFYAWESADTGDEVTPDWGRLANGERVRIWTGEMEEHITACVAWATNHYHRWSDDEDFMRRFGVEMILDGAKYWASRVELDIDGAHIRNVIGPNEYHVPVDDSFFTNAMAAWQLEDSTKVAAWLHQTNPAELRSLLGRLEIGQADLDAYPDVARDLVVDQRANGVFGERQGFFDLESIDVGAFSPNRESLHGLLGDKRTQEVQLVKQADVVMALVLLENRRVDRAVFEANFDYYAPITDHGSSLSLAMHSLAASMIGRPAAAYDYFTLAAAIDHDDAMVRGGLGIHAATQGGILQAAIFGFGGLSIVDGKPTTSPRLPDQWDSLGFSYFHQGVAHEAHLINGQHSAT